MHAAAARGPRAGHAGLNSVGIPISGLEIRDTVVLPGCLRLRLRVPSGIRLTDSHFSLSLSGPGPRALRSVPRPGAGPTRRLGVGLSDSEAGTRRHCGHGSSLSLSSIRDHRPDDSH
eukprot:1558515-Rhodomonas_salina.1